jgi:hypothetical protein
VRSQGELRRHRTWWAVVGALNGSALGLVVGALAGLQLCLYAQDLSPVGVGGLAGAVVGGGLGAGHGVAAAGRSASTRRAKRASTLGCFLWGAISLLALFYLLGR